MKVIIQRMKNNKNRREQIVTIKIGKYTCNVVEYAELDGERKERADEELEGMNADLFYFYYPGFIAVEKKLARHTNIN